MGVDDQALADLKRKRGTIKASLTRVRTFVENFDPSCQAVSLLEFRQEELPRINLRFDEIQCQIELIASEDIEGAELERDKFERDYFAIRSQMQEIINHEKAPSTTGHNVSYGNTSSVNRSQLAPIPLPKFSGNIQEWSSFFDIFQAMVHNDEGYSPAQKFYYLRSCLEGPALNLVRSTPVCDGNYELVIQLLKERYDNRSLVIQSHIRSILDSPHVEKASVGSLQNLYANITTQVAALKALHQPVEHWDAWLITIVTSRLDKDTAHGWLLRQRNTDLPNYSDLEAFLASRCVALEGSEALYQSNVRANSAAQRKNVSLEKRSLFVSTEVGTCPLCSGAHKLYNCEKFKTMPINPRLSFVQEKRMCFNCLSPGHMSNVCKSTYSCRTCKRKHHSLLHFEKQKRTEESEQLDTQQTDQGQSPSTSGVLVAAPVPVEETKENSHVFLATALVMARDKNGGHHQCRAILDSGSQVNFVSKRFANLLQLVCKKSSLPISGIGDNRLRVKSSSELDIKSRTSEFSIKVDCYVLSNIVGKLSSCPEPTSGWGIPQNVSSCLADPSFYCPRDIDLLIGGGSFFDVLGTKKIPLSIGSVTLQESHFGWLVTGKISVCQSHEVFSIGQTIEEDWKVLSTIEDRNYGRTSRTNKRSQEEQETIQHFKQNTIRDEEGRFVVRLPVKEPISKLGETFSMAVARFLNVERRLQYDEHLRNEYIRFMNEYIEMGHMVEASEDLTRNHFYLPHHAVIKASSLTTKIRVVFDASAKSTSGVSLNEILKCGPTVQQDLFSILVRFRKHQFVLTSDIEKMFRQIKVKKEDWDLQKIVWRPSPKEVLRSYQLTTVTYGTTPASFLATYCLTALAESVMQEYPRAAKTITEDFYMDDLMTGADTEAECCQLQEDISAVLNSAKLPLRKWCSNSESVLKNIPKSIDDPLFVLDIGDDDTVKSLGLQWKPVLDYFEFDIALRAMEGALTKRAILSDLNKIFDPLGFLTPVLIKGKIFLQQLWSMKIDWDARLPIDIQQRWNQFYKELDQLKGLSIPRKAIPICSDKIDVHGFCDASEEAYGACICIRSQSNDGKWFSRLLCAKTRVAPLKGNTIPRLELNGALLLAELAQRVAESWQFNIHRFKLWTDSTIVLGWLNSQESRLKTYVANRVAQILDVTDVSQWNHIGTQDNPADIISRGLRPGELPNSRLWWNGPFWLENDESSWSLNSTTQVNEDLPEIRKVKLALVVTDTVNVIFNHYSEWNRMVRGVAWLTIYSKYLRKIVKGPQSLSISNLKEAKGAILRMVQAEYFSKELLALKKGKEIPKNSKLRSLNPFLRNGLILVGGRLENSDISDECKHPVVLPAKHKITRLIFESTHKELLHCGPQLLLASIRQQYWPLKGRLIARSVTTRCITCIRAKPTFQPPLMAPLPKLRVQPSKPFTVSGVDFAGPLIVRSGVRRITGTKAWIAVFVCFSTRAIHLEAVLGLTSEAFIAALRRFMARRGKCSIIHSDNGTNFVGAQKQLVSYLKNCDASMAHEGIEWKFNPPSAPHFGGLWESAVKSTKHHLNRVLKDSRLNLEELTTLLCQIEACVNSRPITPLNSDPSEPEALTPAHFLIGGPLLLIPEHNTDSGPIEYLHRWKYVQALMKTFWKRWHKEYLPQLQVRGKWIARKATLRIGDIAIMKEDCTPPSKWKLGRIINIHPGKDGIVRLATLRTSNGTEVKRPVVKLCRLPVLEDALVENDHFQRGEDVES